MSIIEVGQASRTNGWLGGENQNQGGKQRETRWLTPRHLTDPLGHFDLDPAGAPGHSIATRTLLLENGDDGLVDEWSGRIWLNPPYGKQLEPFMSRLADHLIAAHQESGQGRWLAHDGVYMRCRCGETMHPIHWPAHLALVVEQHSNGRITELEATIARVQNALKGVCDSCDYTDLRAALEGEQQ